MKSSQELNNFTDFDFRVSREQIFAEFKFRTLLLKIIFSRISCNVLESNKNETHMAVFVTLFEPILLKFSKVNKSSKYSLNFFDGSLFSWELIFADR